MLGMFLALAFLVRNSSYTSTEMEPNLTGASPEVNCEIEEGKYSNLELPLQASFNQLKNGGAHKCDSEWLTDLKVWGVDTNSHVHFIHIPKTGGTSIERALWNTNTSVGAQSWLLGREFEVWKSTYNFSLKYGSGASPALRAGALFHWAILEPEKFASQKFVEVQSRNTKKFKEAVAEFGTVYTAKERSETERLVDAFYRNEHAKELITKAEFEIPAIDNVLGMPFRGKADVLGENRICDIKTTTNIKDFSWSANKYGYDVQCYLYCNLFNKEYKNFQFLLKYRLHPLRN